jgi:hypothetical protein
MPATDVSGMLICTGSSVSRLAPFAVTPVKPTEPKLVSGSGLADRAAGPHLSAGTGDTVPDRGRGRMSGYQGPAERQRDGSRHNGPFSSHLRSLPHIALAVMKYKAAEDNGQWRIRPVS